MGVWLSQHVVPEEHEKPPLWVVRGAHPRRQVIDVLLTWLQTEKTLEVANHKARHWIRFAEKILMLQDFCFYTLVEENQALMMILVSEHYYKRQQSQPYGLRRLLPRHSVTRLQWRIRDLRLLLKHWRIKLENEVFHCRIMRAGPRVVQDLHIDVPPWLLDEFSDDP